MNKRISKKRRLAEEKKLIELFRKCDYVRFSVHSRKPVEAKEFTSILDEPHFDESGSCRWFQAEQGKITATGFLNTREVD